MTIHQLIFSTPMENIASRIAEIGTLSTYFQQVMSRLHDHSFELDPFIEDTIAFEVGENADILSEADNWKGLIDDLVSESKPHWNESLVDTLKYYKDYVNNSTEPNAFAPWKFYDLENADAGAGFGIGHLCVIPYLNVDRVGYDAVRGNDQILAVIENSRFLQFTKSKDQPWIRLIMPMNPRRVEIEDLDRNFWVITQGISIICTYLFDDNSSLRGMLKHILKELTQQWENVLYLWLNYEILTARNSHIYLVEDLPNDELLHFKKFDGFDSQTDIDWGANLTGTRDLNIRKILSKRFDYLPKKYSDKFISVLVRVRDSNYNRNWYKREGYPYYGYYDGEQWTWYRLNYGTDKSFFFFNPVSSGYADRLYGVTTNETTYDYGVYSKRNKVAALYIEPTITNGGLEHPSITFTVYDAVECMFKKPENWPVLKGYHVNGEPKDEYWGEEAPNLKYLEIVPNTNQNPRDNPITVDDATVEIGEQLGKALYLGEVPSKYKNFGVISGED